MFRFEDPQYLILLILIPVMFVLRWVSDRYRKYRLRRFGPQLVKRFDARCIG